MFESDPEWSPEVHDHLQRHVEKRLKGAIVLQGRAEEMARDLVDKEMSHLVSTNRIAFVKGHWVFTRGPGRVIEFSKAKKRQAGSSTPG